MSDTKLHKSQQPRNMAAPFGEQRLGACVSLVQGLSPTISEKSTLGAVFQKMKNPDAKQRETAIQLQQLSRTDTTAYKRLKETLPGFIVGEFSYRKNNQCLTYVPLIGFDFDGFVDAGETEAHLNNLIKCPYVFAAYVSPSGCGIRAFVWCDSTTETHEHYYQHLGEYLADRLHLPTGKLLREQLRSEGLTANEITAKVKQTAHLDSGTNEIARFWFYSGLAPEQVFLNLESQVFSIPENAVPGSAPKEKTIQDLDENAKAKGTKPPALTDAEKMELIEKMADARRIEPGRNNRLFFVACTAIEHNVSGSFLMDYCLNVYTQSDFPKTEVRKTVQSAKKKAQPGKFNDEQLGNYMSKISNGTDTPQVQPNEGQTDAKAQTEGDKVLTQNKFIKIREYLRNKYDFRLNIVSVNIEYKTKGAKDWKGLNENDLICELLEKGLNGVEKPFLSLLASSFVPRYDPIKEYFETLPAWEESEGDHIRKLAGFVKAKDQPWFELQFKKMLVRAIACAVGQAPFNKQCFTLVGKQNDGKTSWLRFLCPPTLSDYIKENLDIQSKDGRFALCQNLFVNLDELATFSKTDINQIKNFFTISTVKERLPYDKKPNVFNRRASFLASTNSSEFLTDETGNVRWIVFEIDGILHNNGGPNGYNAQVDINQVWAQAYALFKSGFVYQLTDAELVKSEDNNRNFQVITAEMELIQLHYVPGDENDTFLMTTQIAEELLMVTKQSLNLRNVGKALKKLGFQQRQKFIKEKGYQIKGYFLKRISNSNLLT
jgi:predicted P-loop ATPase